MNENEKENNPMVVNEKESTPVDSNNENGNLNETKKIIIPKYRLVEHQLEFGVEKDIVPLGLEELIFEKMFILFEKYEPAIRNKESAKIDLQMKKEKLLVELDFKKELGITTKPTIADKEAVMRPYLSELEDKVDKCEETVTFYKNKITVLNDLIDMRRLQLKIESALNE